MHAAPISSQRTFLRVFVRLDAHHLLMIHKNGSGKLGGLGGKTQKSGFLKKYKSRDRSRDLYFFRQASFGSRRPRPTGRSDG